MSRRILLATTGSLGDLHPYLAIGLALEQRGYTVTIASSEVYRAKVLRTGLQFAPMGPNVAPSGDLIGRIFDPLRGPELLIRRMLYPAVPEVYRELQPALRSTDLIVTHPITFAAQIAAEKSGLPWISTITAPMSLFSRYDPPVMPAAPALARLHGLGPAVNGMLLGLGRAFTGRWRKPLTEFRASLGLAPGADPLYQGQHSPTRVLALFSRLMAEPQPDWPAQARVVGFPFYDQAEHGQELDAGLARFLDAGPPPVVFTLGSSAVFAAGSFYSESLAAVKQLGCRAVLLAGPNSLPGPLPPGVLVCAYAPYSQVFPRAACVVHQGGMGTCGQALAAGRPMLVMPCAFDQPDNAARLQRLGVARVIARRRYTARTAAAGLDRLLHDAGYAARAADAGRRVAAEDAVGGACTAVKELIG